MNILTLLGAGSSIPAGYPSTADITAQVLSGSGIVRHTSAEYVLAEPAEYAESTTTHEFLRRVLPFLRRLAVEVDCYYNDPCRPVNYEDLYYLAHQVNDSEYRETDNPGIRAFIKSLRDEFAPLMVGCAGEIRERWELGEIASEAVHYIRDVTASLLAGKPRRTDHLTWLIDMQRDDAVHRVTLATLTHDRSLELVFKAAAIDFLDGFGHPIRGVRYWQPDTLMMPARLKLVKLHGSLGWYRFRTLGGSWDQERIGAPVSGNPTGTVDPDGNPQDAPDNRPLFLAGTFNKILSYSGGIYADLLGAFQVALRSSKRLLVCGYSFGDKGINTQIIEWMYSSPDHWLIVIHPNPDQLREAARGAIAGKWKEWRTGKKLVEIPRRMEETTWDEVRLSVAGSG